MTWLSKEASDRLLAKIRGGNEMTRGEKLQLIAQLSVPSILAQVTSVLLVFIDTSMVGHLGANASASIGLVESTIWLFGSVLGAMSTGFSVQTAHFVGANDFSQARCVFRHGLACGLLVSVIIGGLGIAISSRLPFWLGGGSEIATASSFYFLIFCSGLPFLLLYSLCSSMLKCAGDMRTPSVMSVVVCVLDVCFNYLFIYMLGMGVAGAAIGTMSAYIVCSGIMAWRAMLKNEILDFRKDHAPFRWHWQYIGTATKISAPLAFQSVLMGGAQVVSTKIVAPLGSIAIATNSLAITAESLCYMPGYGISDAATTLVGQSMGAGRKTLCRSLAFMTVVTGMTVMAFMGMVMYVFAPELMGLLTPVEGIRTLGVTVLRIEAFAEPFFGAAIVTAAVCAGAGDTLRPAIVNLCSMWFVRLTMAWWLSQSMGIKGVWIAMATELTFRGCMFLLRLFKGNWMKGLKISK